MTVRTALITIACATAGGNVRDRRYVEFTVHHLGEQPAPPHDQGS